MERKSKRIAVVGLWHLGCVYAASFAKKGFDVVGIDHSKEVVENLNKGVAPIFEPGLEDTIKDHVTNLRFSADLNELKNADYIFVTHDVEVDENDKADLATIKKIFDAIAKQASEGTSIVISSQLPVGTSRKLVEALKSQGIKNPKVIYFPENLRLGTAFESFFNPGRIIVGSDSKAALDHFERDLRFECPVIRMNLESAEMVKHALNSYLAMCISWSSELSDLAEKVGAHMPDVVKALKTEKRVSPHAPIGPGLGFAGGTLGRDVQALRSLGRKFSYKPKLLDAVYGVNKDRLPMLVKKMETVYPRLVKKKIGILGLTYKPNTNTLRRSMSLELASLLQERGAIIKAYDPVVKNPVPDAPYIEVCTTQEEFFKDLDLVVLMNECNEFLKVSPKRVANLMKRKVIVDAKNFLDSTAWKKHKFDYIGIGINSESVKH